MDQIAGRRRKDPWHIHLPDHQPFSFAGLWAHNKKLEITSCTIITAPAAGPVSQIHDRMPIILDQTAYDAWLDPSTTAPKQMLSQSLNSKLEFYRVGRQVNSSKYEDADSIEPVNPLSRATIPTSSSWFLKRRNRLSLKSSKTIGAFMPDAGNGGASVSTASTARAGELVLRRA